MIDHISGCQYGENKKGRFFKISVNRRFSEEERKAGAKEYKYTKRWYIPEGVTSDREIRRLLQQEKAAFEAEIKSKTVLSRAEQKAKAEADRIKAEEEARQAAVEAAKIQTVEQYALGVFLPAKEPTIAENTYQSYQLYIKRHILPAIGCVPMQEVTPAMLSKIIIDFQRSGKSHSATLSLHTTLNLLFKMAYMTEQIDRNPMDRIERPKRQSKGETSQDDSDNALTPQQLNSILECVQQEPLKWRAFMQLAVDTGARRGELCGLQWIDIDFDANIITIRHNLQHSRDNGRELNFVCEGVYDTSTKNGKSRIVDIGDDTASILKEWRETQSESHLSPWVFTQDGTSDPMYPSSPSAYFRKFARKYDLEELYGIKNFHPHLLRHSSASISIHNGADLKSVADRLGHSDAVMLRKYVHSNEDSIRQAGQIARDQRKQA